MHDADISASAAEWKLDPPSTASEARASDLLSSPYVLGGTALGIAVAGYALGRRQGGAPREIVQERSDNLGDMLKIGGMFVSLAASLAATTSAAKNNAAGDTVVTGEQTACVPAAPANERPAGKAAPSAATTSPRTTFEHSSASWIGRQWQICVAAGNAWLDDYAQSMGAALSYYTLFSLAPLLVIVIAIAGLIFGQDAAQAAIIGQLGGIMGKEGATALQGLLNAAREPATGIVATVIGGVLVLLGATATFAELQSDLDRIWQVPAKQRPSGIWGWLRSRVLSFGLVLGLAFMLMVSLVISAALSASSQWLGGGAAVESVLASVLNFGASLAIFTVLFAMIYKIMPSVNISWHDVWTGAFVTALLFNVGKSLIGLYLAKSSVASGFGAAGSIVILVAWFYYSAQIFLFGAEYTWVNANSKLRPKAGAG